ncbi:MAG: 2-oxoacid:acceptor oxidoreductase family protein [Acidimicrobiales bacterium]|nr:2-oxoacid:acceptor oxidoreductase family protein [Acidimicrobiales bacterium]
MTAAGEREVLLTGIGGQGVQLAARVLAEAAILDGREVQLFASYGGMMRGGNTDATVVIADEPVDAPPVVAKAWAVLGIHAAHLADPLTRLRDDGVLLLNTTVVDPDDIDTPDGVTRIEHAMSTIAQEVGNPMAGSLVAIGALAAATGIVGVDSLASAMAEALPPYRRQHVDSSVAAIRAGAELAA